MLHENTLLAFVILSFLVELTPGPNMGYLAIISTLHGRAKGLATTAGISTGLLIVGLLALYGLAEIVSVSKISYTILRWSGFLYLLWIAKEGWFYQKEKSEHDPKQEQTYWKYFRQGVLINLLNPKAFVFYLTILPNFMGAPENIAQSGLSLTLTYVLVATIVHTSICFLGDAARQFFKDTKGTQTFSRVLSVLLVFVALWFLWSTR